jgi:hypothetical protein
MHVLLLKTHVSEYGGMSVPVVWKLPGEAELMSPNSCQGSVPAK